MKSSVKTIPVILADDHPVFLSGLKGLIETDPSFEVVACCQDGASALETILKLRPDIAILDVSMPRLTGVEVLERVQAHNLKTRAILLTASANDYQIIEAVERGAYGLMLKDSTADMLLGCMQAVSVGRRWIPQDLVESASERVARERDVKAQVCGALTAREREIVILVAEGQSNKEIARQIGTTEGTVKIHLHNIYQKLNVNNRTALTALAHKYRDQLLT